MARGSEWGDGGRHGGESEGSSIVVLWSDTGGGLGGFQIVAGPSGDERERERAKLKEEVH